MYKSLKKGWIPLSAFCSRYGKDQGNMSRALNKLGDQHKEKLGRTWIVKELELLKHVTYIII